MNVELSQFIIVLVMLGFAFYVFGARTVLRDRIIYMALVSIGVILAFYPDLSTRIANMVGIGRGTDLLLYVFILFSLFHYASLASQFKKVEQQLTILTRALAIQSAASGGRRELDNPSEEQAVAGDEHH